ncbi:MAG: RusA family crossover junction endodeoxyribonuclease [Cyanobacteria bacterium J06638_20]
MQPTLEALLLSNWRIVPVYEMAIAPQSAPQQGQADRWRPKPKVVKYRAWRDEFAAHWQPEWKLPEMPVFIFGMPMPKSWSGKKRERMNGTVHLSRPDTDNMIKAVVDSIYRLPRYEGRNDSEVWCAVGLKFWSCEGYVKIGRLVQG